MGMAVPVYYTADMVRALPDDGNRYEVVYGELLVTPSPRPWHEIVTIRLLADLSVYLERFPVAQLFGSHSDISWGREDVLVSPDIIVVPLDHIRKLRWDAVMHLLLAVEVLSPSSLRFDRFAKRKLFQEMGVPLYWVIDADRREVEVWTPDDAFPVTETHRLTWHPGGAGEPFFLELGRLFRPL
jgi:Uma2 family endonuclease